jgi:small-conductance mechanosensitive channel
MELNAAMWSEASLMEAAVAAGIAAATFGVLLYARANVRRWFARMAATEQVEVLELPTQVLSRTTTPFVLVVALYAGAQWLDPPSRVARVLDGAITVAGFWQAGVWLSTLALTLLERKRRESASDRALLGSLGILGFVARALIWSIVLLLALDNLGVDVTALIAGLGIGGIAVALAVQNVLGDLLASLSITLDKPFVVGDFVIVGDFMGSVEYIGIKSTRLRSLSGEQIVMSNADLLSSRLRNYGRMAERRVVFTLSVTYETPQERLEQLPGVIRRVVERESQARFDRSHFARYGAASLDFETVYYVRTPDYGTYMDVQQRINFALLREFRELGVEFAYPTQKLFLERVGAGGTPTASRRSPDAVSSQRDPRALRA